MPRGTAKNKNKKIKKKKDSAQAVGEVEPPSPTTGPTAGEMVMGRGKQESGFACVMLKFEEPVRQKVSEFRERWR